MTMPLTELQSKYLRRVGHTLKPIVTVGAGGVSSSVLTELERALGDHELIKIRVRSTDRAQRAAVLTKLVAASGATLIQRVGHVALLYRPAEEPKLILPAAR